MRAAPLLAMVLVIGATLAACGSSSKKSTDSSSATTATTAAAGGTTATTAAGGTASAAGASLTISGFAFSPDKLTVAAGAKITITNKDGVEHTVTADDGSFHAPVSGETATLTAPTKPGTYAYHCNIHTTMHGTLVVG